MAPAKKRVVIPRGFVNVPRKGVPYGAVIKARPGIRLVVKKGVGRSVSSDAAMRRSVEALRKKRQLQHPTPAGMTRREYSKLHKLPRPFKSKGMSAMRTMSRLWWDQLARERQVDFRKQFPEATLRNLFPLTATRRIGERKKR